MLVETVIQHVKDGAGIIVLDDSLLESNEGFAMPMLLAVSHVHQCLIREGLRMETSIVAKSGETREVHHVACLLGYGANAVVPYLAQQTVEQLTINNQLSGTVAANVKTYTDVLSEGVIKVIAKMGISTVQSYQGHKFLKLLVYHKMLLINILQVHNLKFLVLVFNKLMMKIKLDRVIIQII